MYLFVDDTCVFNYVSWVLLFCCWIQYYWLLFCRLVVDNTVDMVDYWVTFNEPHVFCMLTYCAGAWPGGHPDLLEVATSALPTGVFQQAMHWIIIAHLKAYDYIHEKRSISLLQTMRNVCRNILSPAAFSKYLQTLMLTYAHTFRLLIFHFKEVQFS